MTDLTVTNLVSCFHLPMLRRLALVAHTGEAEWVQDRCGDWFHATFADTCLRLTARKNEALIYHVTFEDVRESTIFSGSLIAETANG